MHEIFRDPERLQKAIAQTNEVLMGQRTDDGHWVGRLSDSALSTATAISALSVYHDAVQIVRNTSPEEVRDVIPPEAVTEPIEKGLAWLAGQQNPDGGWGDTDKSLSNISTTMLVQSAWHLAGVAEDHSSANRRAQEYLDQHGGIRGLRARYGNDKTFAVPILTNAALAGLVPWKEVAPLPFELAAFPHSLFRFLQMPVVSYAIPALVAIGQARFHHRPPLNPLMRIWRQWSCHSTLKKLEAMQPESGGYLEATPLTAFVVMSLASFGRESHPVVQQGLRFLLDSFREDPSGEAGCWPIDTNLATWATTLAVNALPALATEQETADESISSYTKKVYGDKVLLDWLLGCQHRKRHPFTDAAPGGWGWTNLSGAVPDADDTPGALLALAKMYPFFKEETRKKILQAVTSGIQWLVDLQNRNGGWPTFCKGWGKMPFDRSSVDLTAHALRALMVWKRILGNRIVEHKTTPQYKDEIATIVPLVRFINTAIPSGFRFLRSTQKTGGSWAPLWFGNQYHPLEENPIYGTARVLLAYRDFTLYDRKSYNTSDMPAIVGKALQWLVKSQNADGGWGCRELKWQDGENGRNEQNPERESSIEETAVVLEAVAGFVGGKGGQEDLGEDLQTLLIHYEKGLHWLIEQVESGKWTEPSPIGFYFAKLWYYEDLYPVIFSHAALSRAWERMYAG
jgi:squalene-hopene/tetraprenyl-beta-curcumene cyclase